MTRPTRPSVVDAPTDSNINPVINVGSRSWGCHHFDVGLKAWEMIDRTAFRSFDSCEEADRADRLERWRMTPGERMEVLERLRRYRYPDGKTAPELQRLLETAEFPRR